MGHHVLACFAGFCNPDGTTTGLGTFLAWAAGAFIALCALIGFCVRVGELRENRRRGLPREPFFDMSPAVKELMSGYRQPCYTAPVSAVTPAGIRVRRARCCARGHLSPAQPVAPRLDVVF